MKRYGPANPPKSMRPAPYGAFVLFSEHQAELNKCQISVDECLRHANELAIAIECLLISPLGETDQPAVYARETALAFRQWQARSTAEASS